MVQWFGMNDDIKQQSGSPSSLASPPTAKPPVSFVNGKPVSSPPKKQSVFSNLKSLTKKQWLIGGLVALLLIGGGLTAVLLARPKPKPQPVVKQETPPPPPPTTEPSRLTGVEIPIETNKRPVTGVMIENSPDARPQAGLKDAGVVFEAQAEGGITRYLALFLEGQPEHIGPVRSVRPYYLDFVMAFDAAIAHAGGSAVALREISSLSLKDLDHNTSAFKRVNNRFAPHNLYTSMPGLDAYSKSKGYTTSTFISWLRKKEAPLPTPTATKIDLNISSALYKVHYDYDSTTNTYKRALAGKAHLDEKSGAQLAPKVVVAVVMNRTQSGIYSVYQTTGTGQVLVFQDGEVTIGTWEKVGRRDQLVFKDAGGQVLPLNPGQTWVTVMSAANLVTHAP